MKKPILFIVFFCIFIVCIFSVFYIVQNKNVLSKGNKEVITPPVVESKTSEIPMLRYHYQLGDIFIYDVKYMAKTLLSQESDTLFNLNIEGRLVQKVYEIQRNKAILGYAIQNPIITMPEVETSYSIEEMKKALETEIYVSKNYLGLIETWYFPQSIPSSLRNNIKSLLGNSQVILHDTEKTEWSSTEEDQNGSYTARYKVALLPDSPFVMLYKKKLSYQQVQNQKMPQVLRGNIEIQFHPKLGYIDSLEVFEELAIRNMDFIGKGSFEIKLKLEKRENDPTISHPMDHKLTQGNMYTTKSFKVEGEEELRINRLKSIVGNKTWKDLEKEWPSIQEEKDQATRNNFFKLLTAWMELNPNELHQVGKIMLMSKEWDRNVGLLCGALTECQVPEAQELLLNVMDQRKDNENFVTMISSNLGLVKQPTDATLQTLQNISQENRSEQVTNIANLAIGNIISTIKKTNPEKVNSLIYDFEVSLKNESTPSKQMNYIETLGNVGNSSSVPILETFVKHKDVPIRSRAYHSLRFMNDVYSEELLSKGLQEEEHPHVRRSILDAMSSRNNSKSTLDVLMAAFTSEKDPNVRIKEAHIIWKMRREFPEVENFIRRYADIDTSEKVRNSLRYMLVDAN